MYDEYNLFDRCLESILYDNVTLEGLYDSEKMVAANDPSIRDKVPGRTKSIYVMITFSNTLCGRVTLGVTKGVYSHASLVLDKNFNKIYSFAYDGLIEEKLNLRGYVNDGAKYALYELKVTPKEYKQIVYFVELLKARNPKYDWTGFVLTAFNVKHGNERYYICSGFVNSALEYAGIYVFNKTANLVRPDDFSHNPNFKLVKKGLIADLRKELGVPDTPLDNPTHFISPDLYK